MRARLTFRKSLLRVPFFLQWSTEMTTAKAQTRLSPSAHVDTFTRDNLPPVDQWPDLLFDLPELQYPDRLNCAEELLGGSIARFGPHRPCLRDASGTVWSYGEVREWVDRIAQVLADDLGILPGNRVLLRGPNNPELVACWLAVLKVGAVV